MLGLDLSIWYPPLVTQICTNSIAFKIDLKIWFFRNIKNQLDQDLQFYQESLGNLKHAQTKFQDSGDSLGKFTPENKDKEILVPLTGSMYVPGQLSNSENVLVDIGTGM